MVIKKFRRKIQKTLRKFLKNVKEFYKTNETLVKIYEKLDIFFFGISYSMGYLPNSKGLQGMNDIDEG